MTLFQYLYTGLRQLGKQNREAIQAFHDHKAGERGAFGPGEHVGRRPKPNRHAKNKRPRYSPTSPSHHHPRHERASVMLSMAS